jgi:hypothetical protein
MGERFLNELFQRRSEHDWQGRAHKRLSMRCAKGGPMNKIAILGLVAAATVMAMPAAYAYDYSDIRSDWRHIQRDRARLHANLGRLRDERGELAAAERYENWALHHGRFWQAWRAERLERREAADVRALERKVYRDRVDLARDRADLRRDLRGW